MPWCTECDRFLSPSSVRPDGTCPGCRLAVDPGRARPRRSPESSTPEVPAPTGAPVPPSGVAPVGEGDEPLPPVPWHLKLLLAAVALYLGWRAVQGVAWLVERL